MGGPRFGLAAAGGGGLPSTWLAARFGFLLRRNDQRPASSDVGAAGVAAGVEGEGDGEGEGVEGAGGLVVDSAGDAVSGDVCKAAPDRAAFF